MVYNTTRIITVLAAYTYNIIKYIVYIIIIIYLSSAHNSFSPGGVLTGPSPSCSAQTYQNT